MIQLITDLPTVCFTLSAWLRLRLFADLVRGEVGGLGLVEVVDSQHIVVQDVFLVEQYCSAGSTELDSEGIACLLAELADGGVDVGHLRLWWHTHLGAVFLSDRDRETLREGFPQADYIVAAVINRRGDVFTSLYQYRPLAVVAEPLTVSVVGPDGRDLLEGARAEVASKIRTTSVAVVVTEAAKPGGGDASNTRLYIPRGG